MPITKESYYIDNPGQTPQTPGYFNGYISNFRFTVGQALYRGNFTPPTTQLTANTVGTTGPNVVSVLTGEVKALLFQTLGNALVNASNIGNLQFTSNNVSTPSIVPVPTTVTYEYDWVNALNRRQLAAQLPEFIDPIMVGDVLRVEDSDTGYTANITVTAVENNQITFNTPVGFPTDRLGGMTLVNLSTYVYKSSIDKPVSNPFKYQDVGTARQRLWMDKYVENKILTKYFIDRSAGLSAPVLDASPKLENITNPLINGTRGDFRLPILGQSLSKANYTSYNFARDYIFDNDLSFRKINANAFTDTSTRTIIFSLQDAVPFAVNSNVRIYNSLTRTKVETTVLSADRGSITVDGNSMVNVGSQASTLFIESANASVYSYTESQPTSGVYSSLPRDRLWWAQNFPSKFFNGARINAGDPSGASLNNTQSNLSVFTDQVLYLYDANKPLYSVTSQTYQTSNIAADYIFDRDLTTVFNQPTTSGNVTVYFNNTDLPIAANPFPVGSQVVLYRNTPGNILFSSTLFTPYVATVLESSSWFIKVAFPSGWDRTWQFYKIGRATSDVYPKLAVAPRAAPQNARENLYYGELAQGFRYNLSRDGGTTFADSVLPSNQGNWTGNTNNWFTNLSSDTTYRRLYYLQFSRNAPQSVSYNFFLDDIVTIVSSGALLGPTLITDVSNASLATVPTIFDIVNLQQGFTLLLDLFSTNVEQYLTQIGKIYKDSQELKGDRVTIDIGNIEREQQKFPLVGLSNDFQLKNIDLLKSGAIHFVKGSATEQLFKVGQLRYLIGGKQGTYAAIGQDASPYKLGFINLPRLSVAGIANRTSTMPQFSAGAAVIINRLVSENTRLSIYNMLFVNRIKEPGKYNQAGQVNRFKTNSVRISDISVPKKEPVSFWS